MLPHCLIDDICLPVFENTYIVIIILLCLFIYVFMFLYFLTFILSIFCLFLVVSSFQSGRSTRVWSGPKIGQRFLLDKTCPSSLH